MTKLEVYSYNKGSVTHNSDGVTIETLYRILQGAGFSGRMSSDRRYASLNSGDMDIVLEITGTEGSERFGG